MRGVGRSADANSPHAASSSGGEGVRPSDLVIEGEGDTDWDSDQGRSKTVLSELKSNDAESLS